MAEPKHRLESLRTETPSKRVRTGARYSNRAIKLYQQEAKRVSDFYEGGADLDSKLSIATSRGDAEQAARFIAQGANVNQQEPGGLPLIHEAIGLGHKPIVEAILASGRCDLTVRDFMGRLPSDVAGPVAKDYELADRLAEEQARQFRAKNMDPRRPNHPEYGTWKWEP